MNLNVPQIYSHIRTIDSALNDDYLGGGICALALHTNRSISIFDFL